MTERERFIIELCSYIGTPYIYGGEDPAVGLDCSGFAQKALSFYGLDPKGDQGAAALFGHFADNPVSESEVDLGDLIFYGTSGSIYHVAIALSPFKIIEAGGGDHTTTTIEEAIKRNAKVRIKDFDHRKGERFAILRPRQYPFLPDTTLVSKWP